MLNLFCHCEESLTKQSQIDVRSPRRMNGLAMTFIIVLASLIWTGKVYAGNVSVRLAEPKSPTNRNNFDLNFVAMDLAGNAVTVKCYKQAPGDAGLVQFGSDINLTPNGGNSGYCHIDSSIVTGNGSYNFQVKASSTGGDATSETVSLTYNSDGPGTPTNWSKDKTGSCTYKIHFRSADDSGKTIKVNVYRSSDTSFNLDGGTQVGTVTIGSNTDADFSNDVPDCGKTYYYAVRAFDSAGNGSGVLGDTVNVTTTTVVAGTPTPAQGAIPVSGGSVLGTETGASGPTGTAGAEGQTLGEASPAAEVVKVNEAKKSIFPSLGFLGNNAWIWGGAIIVVLGIIALVIIL
jgi:hypothetical protein